MQVQMQKWGNSLAVRVPKAIVEDAKLAVGDQLEIEVDAQGMVRLQRLSEVPTLAQLAARITPENLFANSTGLPRRLGKPSSGRALRSPGRRHRNGRFRPTGKPRTRQAPPGAGSDRRPLQSRQRHDGCLPAHQCPQALSLRAARHRRQGRGGPVSSIDSRASTGPVAKPASTPRLRRRCWLL